jgi:hypothetical protein
MTTMVYQVEQSNANARAPESADGEPLADIRFRYITGEISAEAAIALSREHYQQVTAREAAPF